MKYLLVILAKSDKQDEFVNFIANELTTLCQNNQVKFFYTQESIFFSFETDIDVSGLEGIIFDMFNHMDLIYFLLIMIVVVPVSLFFLIIFIFLPSGVSPTTSHTVHRGIFRPVITSGMLSKESGIIAPLYHLNW
mgnify:CR=1 FL=1